DVAVALESTRLTDRDDRAGLSRADRERAEDPDVDPGVTRAERGRDRSACRPGRPLGRSGSSGKRRARERKREEEGQHGGGAYQRIAAFQGFRAILAGRSRSFLAI